MVPASGRTVFTFTSLSSGGHRFEIRAMGGMGLPITKGFAELLGGSISVESEVGKGSRFTVRVPVVYREEIGTRRV